MTMTGRPTAPPGLVKGIPAFQGRKVTIVGLGLFGGGVAATRFACAHGAEVTVTDLRSREDLLRSVDAISDLSVRLRLGEHVAEDFDSADLLIVSPGVPGDSPWLERARMAGVEIETELNYFWKACPAPIIAVTGSNGKSTTASLITAILEAVYDDGRVYLGGNIGKPLVNQLDGMSKADLVVLEVSSFQLEALDQIQAAPDVAVVVNLTPNHLDRHGSMEAYVSAKASILRHQSSDQHAVLNRSLAGHPGLRVGQATRHDFGWEPDCAIALEGDTVTLQIGEAESACLDERILPGRFNLENIAAAMGVVRLVLPTQSPVSSMAEAVRSFPGIPHRLEPIPVDGDVKYINDSIATSPESTVGALDALSGKLTLICGGYDKGMDLSSLVEAAARRCDLVVTIGATGEGIADRVVAAGGIALQAGTLREAVSICRERVCQGTVLLSPACASYDQYINFEARGDEFRRLVTGEAE